MQISEDNNIQNICPDEGLYLILHSSVMGDYYKYCDMIFAFADNNGMVADRKNIFAVYDAKESCDNPKIKMYCKVCHSK